MSTESNVQDPEPVSPPRSRRTLIIGVAALVLAVIAAAAVFLLRKEDEGTAFPAFTPFTYSGHGDAVLTVGWSPDGMRIASGGWDKSVHIYDSTGNREVIECARMPMQVRSLAWSPDSTRVALADFDGNMNICDAATGKTTAAVVAETSTFAVTAVDWSPDGAQLVVGAAPDARVLILDAATLQQFQVYTGHAGYIQAVAWSPDGEQIASSDSRGSSKDTQLHIWTAADASKRGVEYRTDNSVDAMAWSPDSARLAANSGRDNGIQIIDIATRQVERTYTVTAGEVFALAWSPDGEFIAAADSAGPVVVHRPSGEKVFTFTGHPNRTRAVDWAPDSSYVASADGEDDTVQVWRVVIG
ncbi:WD40 repeat domain-containing protein [Nocardia crassostreae]|uniref:WD40 repeat domain-containing protein n=1 Tax=Nocardia crassostreae TaxID=53428 RepID=UPI000836A1F7|nr:WD40 repeat domain-containing protein [Nocardia crassostreae]